MKNFDGEKLLQLAKGAAKNAYAPYSGFKVGSALLTADGEIFTGCNVENASYGLSCCAERGAVFAAVAAGKKDFAAIAIASPNHDITVPCGACLQVLEEFNSGNMLVITGKNEGNLVMQPLSSFLPISFRLTDGGQNK